MDGFSPWNGSTLPGGVGEASKLRKAFMLLVENCAFSNLYITGIQGGLLKQCIIIRVFQRIMTGIAGINLYMQEKFVYTNFVSFILL